ncbi:MAG: hypothetical protein HZA08_13710 [Nitrospirae bacterium]|nr:hypothetical protein [Nitrospirota bacterium]
MEGVFNEAVSDRLPAVIRSLDQTHQKVYIHLRLGKKEDEIATLIRLPPDDAKEKISKIRGQLAAAGHLYLIEDPQFVSLYLSSEDGEEEHERYIPSADISVDNKLIIHEFISILKKTIEGLLPNHSRILRLRYQQYMTAKDILGFSRKIGVSLIPGKSISEIDEQDIFYAINSALKELLKRLKERYMEEHFLCMDNLKYILEEVEI